MSRFCARVRKRTDLPSVSIKESYLPSHSSPGKCVDFVHAAQRTCKANFDFWFKGST